MLSCVVRRFNSLIYFYCHYSLTNFVSILIWHVFFSWYVFALMNQWNHFSFYFSSSIFLPPTEQNLHEMPLLSLYAHITCYKIFELTKNDQNEIKVIICIWKWSVRRLLFVVCCLPFCRVCFSSHLLWNNAKRNFDVRVSRMRASWSKNYKFRFRIYALFFAAAAAAVLSCGSHLSRHRKWSRYISINIFKKKNEFIYLSRMRVDLCGFVNVHCERIYAVEWTAQNQVPDMSRK